MFVPDYVKAYDAARWWYFIHVGLPMGGIGLVVLAVGIFQNYWEDVNVSREDECESLSKTAGKTLGI